jgi:hypothetical protein
VTINSTSGTITSVTVAAQPTCIGGTVMVALESDPATAIAQVSGTIGSGTTTLAVPGSVATSSVHATTEAAYLG